MKTKKIRISVAMMPDGEWNCCGWGAGGGKRQPSNKELMESAVDIFPYGESLFWVEAEIPIPEILTIHGEVLEASE